MSSEFDLPPNIAHAMLEAKRRGVHPDDSELGGERGKLSEHRTPGRSPRVVPKVNVTRGELPGNAASVSSRNALKRKI